MLPEDRRLGPQSPLSPTADRAAPTWLLVLLPWLLLAPAGPVRAGEPLPACEDCNLLIVVIDTLRSDHLGYNGYTRDTSPALDAFVADSRRYDACTAQATWTIPSTASLLCSAYPSTHRLEFSPGRTDQWHALGEGLTPLPEVLQGEGFGTAAFVGNPVLRPKLGFDRGFDRYVIEDDPEAIVDAAAQMARWGDQRFFLYLHLLGPHPGLQPPPPYDAMFGPAPAPLPDGGLSYQHVRAQSGPSRPAYQAWFRDLYDAEIRYTDQMLGSMMALLETHGILEDTVVVLTSDHGEHLFEKGLLGHGMTVFEALTHVPLVIRVPGDTVRSEGTVVEQVDLAPALLEVLGVEVDPAWGWEGGPLASDDTAFVEQGPRQAIRRGPHKLIVDRSVGTTSLYDLRADPGETRDIGSLQPDLRADLRAELERWRVRALRPITPLPLTLDPEDIERLRALGYVE